MSNLTARPNATNVADVDMNAFVGSHDLLFVTLDTLRYDVETPAGLVLKVDVRDAWHHRPIPVGEAVRVGFPASVALTLRDD